MLLAGAHPVGRRAGAALRRQAMNCLLLINGNPIHGHRNAPVEIP